MSKRRLSVTLGTEQTDLEKGLIRRGGGWYSTRQITPKDLLAHYGYGAKVVALGTQDHKEAKRLHLQTRIAFLEEFEQVRRELAAAAATPEPEPRPVTQISPTVVSLVNLDRLREERDEAAKSGQLPAFMREQKEALAMTQAMLDGERPATMDYRELEGLRNGLRAFLTGENSLAIAAARAARSPAPVAQQPPKPTGKGTSPSQVVDRWAAEMKPKERTVTRTRNIVERFQAVEGHGKLTVEEITKHHVIAFKDALIAQGSSAANINVMIPMLGTVLIYAVDKLHLIDVNPAARIRVADKRKAKDKRRAFEEAELERIFASPVYSGDVRPEAGGGEAAYWLPLASLYTGGRQTELGQLHPDDVVQEAYRDADDKERKAWVIRIVENAERGQIVKNEGSERRVPVHADLIALGFIKLVEKAKQEKRERIFPAIRPTAKGELMGNWSKWFGRYRRNECDLKSRMTPFHSFRHTFKHYMRLAAVPSEVHNELTGHETGDVADSYGGLSYPLRPLVEGMEKYRVPGVTLPQPPPAYRA
jgi:integrase